MLNVYPYKSRRRFESSGRTGGINVDQTWMVKTEAVGKSQWNESPYLLANEWICASIAQFLRLPVPPFAIAQKKSRRTAMFISYSYDGDTKPDDVDPQPLYDNFPDICTGIVMFDVLVANCDRQVWNLQVDNPSNPKAMYIIDHERALFYVWDKEGINRLQSRENRLGVTDGDSSGDEWHCLVKLLDSVSLIGEWVSRIESIPDWFIDSICEEVWKISITEAECNAAKLFLKNRKRAIGRLILNHTDRFPLINGWPLFF